MISKFLVTADPVLPYLPYVFCATLETALS